MPKHERDSMISISIVSHGQGALVQRLLADLAQFCGLDTEVILTENIPEPAPGPYPFAASPLKIVKNNAPRGFGANHNEAFRHATGEFFCVLNPDVRLPSNPFPALLSELESRSVGVVAPLIVNTNGDVEDSAHGALCLRSANGSRFVGHAILAKAPGAQFGRAHCPADSSEGGW